MGSKEGGFAIGDIEKTLNSKNTGRPEHTPTASRKWRSLSVLKELHTSLDVYLAPSSSVSPFQVALVFISTWFYLCELVGAKERTVGFWTLYSFVEDFVLPLRKGLAKMTILRRKMGGRRAGVPVASLFFLS